MPFAEFGAYKVTWESGPEDEEYIEGREVVITGPFQKGKMVLDEYEAEDLVEALQSFIDDTGIWIDAEEDDED